MLQFLELLVKTLGNEALKLAFLAFFYIILLIYTLYIIHNKLPLYVIGLSLICFGLGYLLITKQEYFAEKVHVIEYGILGYLALRDLFKAKNRPIFMKFAYSLAFIILIGFLDEGFQWLLPYRVFELKDVATNMLSGGLGIALCGFFKIR